MKGGRAPLVLRMRIRGDDPREACDQLEFEVELVAAAGVCPTYGRGSVDVKERPLVRVLDLPLAGSALGRPQPRLLPARGLLLRLRLPCLARLAWRRILLRALR